MRILINQKFNHKKKRKTILHFLYLIVVISHFHQLCNQVANEFFHIYLYYSLNYKNCKKKPQIKI